MTSERTATNETRPHARAGTLVDRVHALVVQAILGGELPPGARLPAESELASRFGASRSTVREALSRLRADGIIETRQGSGSHVVDSKAPPGTATPAVQTLADVERFYAFRSCIESGAAAAAAEHWETEDLAALRAGLEALRQAMESGRPNAEADTQFHVAIARASHNPFFMTTLTTVVPMRQFVDVFRTASDKRDPQRLRSTHAEHEAIFDAIASRSPQEAEQAMRRHVLNTRLRLLESMRLR